jgi:hypothetical protein
MLESLPTCERWKTSFSASILLGNRTMWALTDNRPAQGSTRNRIQRVLQIGNQIGGVFDPN